MGKITTLFAKVLDFADVMGARDLGKRDNLWTAQVDEHWSVSFNGTDHEVERLPGFTACLKYDGCAAMFVTVTQGMSLTGPRAEADAIAALDRRIEAERRANAVRQYDAAKVVTALTTTAP